MLTFQELIGVPLFSSSTILGGWEGKERSFRNIQDQITDVTESVLILLPLEKEHVIKLPDYLPHSHIQGVILYGDEEFHLPSSLSERLNEFQKPILIVKGANLHTIKKKITDVMELKSYGHYHYVLNGMTDYWIEFINKQPIEQMFNRLRLFVDESLLLLDNSFSPYFDGEEGGTHGELREIRDLYYRQSKAKEGWTMVNNQQRHYLLFPLRLEDQNLGYVLLKEQPGMMLDTCIEMVTHAIPALITHLKKEEAVLHTHQIYKDNFLYNLLYNNMESEHVLIELGKQWGWDFTNPTQLMVLKFQAKGESSLKMTDINASMGTIRSVMASHFLKGIIHQIQGNIVMIIFDPFERTGKERKDFMISLAKSIIEEIEKVNSSISCQIGLGRQYPTNMKLYKSFYEGKVALELGKYEIHHQAVRHFEDIGIARLLSNVQNDLLREYYEEILGDLIHLDQSKDDFYIDTLQAFFQNNGDIGKTAEQLFVHPNTLRKRIKKIESILNCNLNQIDDQIKIVVALKIMKMLS